MEGTQALSCFFQNRPLTCLTVLILTAPETSNTSSHLQLDSTPALSHTCLLGSRTSSKLKLNNANGNPPGTQWSLRLESLPPTVVLNVFHTGTRSELLASSMALGYTLTLYLMRTSSPGSSSYCCLADPISTLEDFFLVLKDLKNCFYCSSHDRANQGLALSYLDRFSFNLLKLGWNAASKTRFSLPNHILALKWPK